MARLTITSDGFKNRVVELKLGVNRFGRSPENDFQVEDASVSARHCELVLRGDSVLVRDSGSAAGTFVDDRPIREATLRVGQKLRLGDVVLLVESTEVKIAIPKFEMPRPAVPVVLANGTVLCPRHPKERVTHQCTRCRELLCDECLHRLRRLGGRTLKLCPLCSHKCEPLVRAKRKKKARFGFLQKSLKLSRVGGGKSRDGAAE